MERLADCIAGGWKPAIGDPSLMGWMTVGVYAVAAVLSFVVVARQPFPHVTRKTETRFWLLAAVALTLLCINKQLDLQSLLTASVRCMAKSQAWYQERRILQFAFIAGLVGIAAVGFVLCLLSLRNTLRRTALPLLGLSFVALFVVIRAASFHHVDQLINSRILFMRMNWVLELPGPLLVIASALWLLRSSRIRVEPAIRVER